MTTSRKRAKSKIGKSITKDNLTGKRTNSKIGNTIAKGEVIASARRVDKRFSIVAVVIFAVLVGWITYNNISVKNSSTSTSVAAKPREVTPLGPEIVSPDTIRKTVSYLGHALYWEGEKANQQLELSITKDGSAYIRYLPLGKKAGSKGNYDSVTTFSDANAYAHLQTKAGKSGAISAADNGGAFVVEDSKNSLTASFAYKNYPIRIEVQTNTPGRAWDLIQTGVIKLVL